jgi:hypothetical protein
MELFCRRELLSTGSASLSAALLAYCRDNAGHLLRSGQGGELLECLCNGHGMSTWMWEKMERSLAELHGAIVTAACGSAVEPSSSDEEAEEGKQSAGRAQTPAMESTGAQVLMEDFFASRTLKRIVAEGQGSGSEAFVRLLWQDALKGRIAELMGTHAAKVISAAACCSVEDVAKGVRTELESALGSVSVEVWLEGFIRKQTTAKGHSKTKNK